MNSKRHLPDIEQRRPGAGSSWPSWPKTSKGGVLVAADPAHRVQRGFLAEEDTPRPQHDAPTEAPHSLTPPPSRSLPQAHAWGLKGVLWGWAFSYGRGTPVRWSQASRHALP